MRNFVLALPLVLLSGCASAPYLIPAGGVPQATAAVAGATITVFPSEWEGEPWDLAEYVTPVAIELYNGGTEPVRISYFDFALSDEKGFRYAALNPFVTAQTAADQGPERIEKATMVARRGPIFIPPPAPGGMRRSFGVPPPAPRFGGGFGSRPRVFVPAPRRVGPPRAFVRGGVYLGSSAWRNFVVLPYYRPWFGAGMRFWNDPWLYPPGYATWVWAWSPSYYPSRTPPTDVINLGLPEGVLEPGGHVSGYIYFQRSQPDAEQLTLSWQPAQARTGQPLGETRIALEVKR